MAMNSGKGILANYFVSLGELYNEVRCVPLACTRIETFFLLFIHVRVSIFVQRPYVFAGEAFVLFLLFYFTFFKRPYDPSKKCVR